MWVSSLIPKNLTGKSVLDIAAWDGFYSIIAKERGATKVLSIDSGISEKIVFNQEPETLCKKYKHINKELGYNIKFKLMDISEMNKLDNFDVIFNFGIFYHAKNPYDLFEKCYDITNDMLLLEGHVIPSPSHYEMAYFYGKDECNEDPTVYWGMTPDCILKMLNRIGFRKTKFVALAGDRVLMVAIK
jgi:tRNA (mo5U34)-methyltransferase